MSTSNVTIVSPFRDNEHQIAAYWQRINALRWPADSLRFVLVEGDSTDRTWYELGRIAVDDARARAVKQEVFDKKHPSVINPRRFKNLARVFNAGLNSVDLDWSDFVLMLPSDVTYGANLLNKLTAWNRDIIAPFVWLNDMFYDTWAFVQNGQNWHNFKRQELSTYGEQPVQMDSVGCVTLMRSAVLAAGIRYPEMDVDRGLCRLAREHGFSVWADPTTQVQHP